MKKNILLAALFLGVGAVAVSSCSSDKKAEESDSVAEVVEVPAEEASLSIDEVLLNTRKQLAPEASDTVWTTTPSGLKYLVVKEGTGSTPGATDEVTVHYTGRLTNGEVFDSSVERGEPATFPLNRVIKGWTEGLQLMKEGGKTVFYIPSDLAYGETGTPGGPIGPNEPLIFEVELIKVGK
ncbi:MAG: FKBP-type peptidyl-prolyl cis-trans isomerase [Muribaculaceae bacterium]|nr:FKBP-type peptidyl-prolyl cis-trans isomerase [Muribaculaceae bacterium]